MNGDQSKINRSTPNWLAEFAAAIPCSPGFILEMDKQLGKQFKDATGLDLDSGFQLLRPFPEPFQIAATEGDYMIQGEPDWTQNGISGGDCLEKPVQGPYYPAR